MEKARQKKHQGEVSIMLQDVNRDPQLRRKFFKEPEKVAREYNVQLSPEQIEKVKLSGNVLDKLSDLDLTRVEIDPVYYPADAMMVRDVVERHKQVICYLFYLVRSQIPYYPPYYPAPFDRFRRQVRFDR